MDPLALKEKMVKEQLISRGINDPKVLAAFRKVPRDKFVLKKYIEAAYADYPLPIGAGQTISQPYIVALMTQYLELSGNETVLEIGTGSGYQAAILAELAAKVYSVERVKSLAERARSNLKDLGYRNIEIKVADGTLGWKEFSPYDGIIATAGAPNIPRPLIEQLKIKTKLVIPIGGRFNQMLTAVTKYEDKTESKQICACIFVPLVGRYAWEKEDA